MTRRAFLWITGAMVLSLGCDSFASPPGEGSVAERGYRNFQPAIEALEVYHQREGRYPDSLEELIRSGDLVQAPDAPQPDHIAQYTASPDGYELLFTYTGPGMNRCVYRPESGWGCEGYF